MVGVDVVGVAVVGVAVVGVAVVEVTAAGRNPMLLPGGCRRL